MEFQEQKKQITDALVRHDIKKIAERAGVSPQTVRSTLKLDSLSFATDRQMKVWDECLSLLDERKKRATKIENRAVQIAETLQ